MPVKNKMGEKIQIKYSQKSHFPATERYFPSIGAWLASIVSWGAKNPIIAMETKKIPMSIVTVSGDIGLCCEVFFGRVLREVFAISKIIEIF